MRCYNEGATICFLRTARGSDPESLPSSEFEEGLFDSCLSSVLVWVWYVQLTV